MSDCIFCRIIRGEIPARVVDADERVLAILDAFPMTAGHVLLLPKRHAAELHELESADAEALGAAAVRAAARLRERLGAEGVNLVMNSGECAGQTVAHAHWHLVPRFTGDGLGGFIKSGRADAVALDAVLTRLRP